MMEWPGRVVVVENAAVLLWIVMVENVSKDHIGGVEDGWRSQLE